MSFASSAHYIVGYVNDALDGESANGKTVLLWNPSVGINENLIEIVGPGGSSGQDNMYMFDCELLTNGCDLGDELGIKVIDNGGGYTSHPVFVNVTVSGYDFVENITLNSFPEASLNAPKNMFYSSISSIDFNCSFSDLDEEGGNLSMFGNFSGNWEEVDRQEIQKGSYVFSKSYSEGSYLWTCVSEDVLGAETFGENRSLFVDLTSPVILSFEANDSVSCGNTTLDFLCQVEDNMVINRTLLEVRKPSSSLNLTMENVSLNYTKKVLLDEVGEWNFRCISEDLAGNYNFSDFLKINSHSGYPELYINESRMSFENIPIREKEKFVLNSFIENVGCVDSGYFNISFFEENVSSGNEIERERIQLNSFSEIELSINYTSLVGLNNFFAYVDWENEIFEHNESNNFANASFGITLWQKLYGNISAIKTLRTTENFASWSVEENIVGNIFVTDSESSVDWLKLKAIGRDIFDQENFGDFLKIDELLGTSDLEDSISKVYLEEESPKQEKDFFIYQNNITNVSVVNSTSSGNFVTGILWDTSDDSGDGGFDVNDKEDLVFVTKINKETEGEFGIYDYEISIPVNLREYYEDDVEEVYLYYDLV